MHTVINREFEELYYQQRPEQIHFVCQSIHHLYHMSPETIRTGPYPIYSQSGMERTIGNLGEEIKLHSDPYGNLAKISLRRCQINALTSMIPGLDIRKDPQALPQGAFEVGDGYRLLKRMDSAERRISDAEAAAIRQYFTRWEPAAVSPGWLKSPKIYKWARLQIPTEQVARLLWKEEPMEKRQRAIRQVRNVKVCIISERSCPHAKYSVSLNYRTAALSSKCSIISKLKTARMRWSPLILPQIQISTSNHTTRFTRVSPEETRDCVSPR